MSKPDIKAIALSWAKEQLEDPDWMGIFEHAELCDVDLTEDEAEEVIKAIGDLVVAPRQDVPKAYAWKTVIEDRRPTEKLHRTLGLAKSAISHPGWHGVRGGKLYENRGNGWELLHDVEPGSANTPWQVKR